MSEEPTRLITSVAEVHGTVLPGYEGVRAAFEANLASGQEIGASFSVYHDGAPVVDLWGGHSTGTDAAEIAKDTLFALYSATKGLAAICVAMLVERGKLDYEAPVSAYWPEFANGGKAAITVGEVMSHQAGLPGTRAPVTLDNYINHDAVAALLAAQEPFFSPGVIGYHALTVGTLSDELVRRTDGRTIGRFFAEEVGEKLGIDVFLGLPSREDHRFTKMVSAMDDSTVAFDIPNPDVANAALSNPPIIAEWPNDRRWREAGLAAAGGIGSARGLAQLYATLVSDEPRGGARLVSKSVLEQATRERICGVDQCLGSVLRYAAGFRLNTGTMGSNPASFGHAGFGGSTAFADPARRLGVAYTTNKMLNPDWQAVDPRLANLVRALYVADAANKCGM
jgi:CubicO group peptidase (beta-lactamase class C family)